MSASSIQPPSLDQPERSVDQQMNRACEACRLLKVRCLADVTSTSAICQRCKKSGRICVYAAPQKRRQRIRTDTRVAELEREIRAMRALLTGGDEPVTIDKRSKNKVSPTTIAQDSTDIDTSTTLSSGEEKGSADENGLSRHLSTPTLQSETRSNGVRTSFSNIQRISRETCEGKDFGLLPRETSDQLFESYNNDLVHYYPIVIFPKNIRPDEIRRSKPILFQAVVTAAACQLDSGLFGDLFSEITKIYAERVVINGEKSLELIQSLLLTSIWYCPPDTSCGPSNLRFYQYIHMAATMTVDMGIGLAVDKETVTLDECRSLLGCYLNCSGIALRMRRPNMMHWTDGMSDCMEVLETSPDILDQRFVAWIRLQKIADDWSKNMGLINTHTEVTLRGFERQLQIWKETAGPGVINISLALSYHQDSIYLHESALESGATTLYDFNHRVFKPPSELRIGPETVQTQPPLTACYVSAVMSCIESSHALLDEFFNTDLKSLRLVPVVHFVRSSYAIVVLVKLFISASVPSSELGKILDLQVLRVDFYMEALLSRLAEAAGPEKLRVPAKWLQITEQINEWYLKHVTAFGRGQRQNHDRPNVRGTACVSNASTCGIDAALPPNDLNNKPPCKPGSFKPTFSLKDQAMHNRRTRESQLPPSLNNTTTMVAENSMPLALTSEHPDTHAPLLTTDSNSQPTAVDFTTMDFTQNDFSFLDIPGGVGIVPGSFDAWMAADNNNDDNDADAGMALADMNFDFGDTGSGAGTDWGFNF